MPLQGGVRWHCIALRALYHQRASMYSRPANVTSCILQLTLRVPSQGQVGLASSADGERLAALKADASRRLDGTRDLVGIRKQALVATEAGELFALHTGDGRVLWHTRVDAGGLPLLTLKVARVPHAPQEDIEVRAPGISSYICLP